MPKCVQCGKTLPDDEFRKTVCRFHTPPGMRDRYTVMALIGSRRPGPFIGTKEIDDLARFMLSATTSDVSGGGADGRAKVYVGMRGTENEDFKTAAERDAEGQKRLLRERVADAAKVVSEIRPLDDAGTRYVFEPLEPRDSGRGDTAFFTGPSTAADVAVPVHACCRTPIFPRPTRGDDASTVDIAKHGCWMGMHQTDGTVASQSIWLMSDDTSMAAFERIAAAADDAAALADIKKYHTRLGIPRYFDKGEFAEVLAAVRPPLAAKPLPLPPLPAAPPLPPISPHSGRLYTTLPPLSLTPEAKKAQAWATLMEVGGLELAKTRLVAEIAKLDGEIAQRIKERDAAVKMQEEAALQSQRATWSALTKKTEMEASERERARLEQVRAATQAEIEQLEKARAAAVARAETEEKERAAAAKTRVEEAERELAKIRAAIGTAEQAQASLDAAKSALAQAKAEAEAAVEAKKDAEEYNKAQGKTLEDATAERDRVTRLVAENTAEISRIKAELVLATDTASRDRNMVDFMTKNEARYAAQLKAKEQVNATLVDEIKELDLQVTSLAAAKQASEAQAKTLEQTNAALVAKIAGLETRVAALRDAESRRMGLEQQLSEKEAGLAAAQNTYQAQITAQSPATDAKLAEAQTRLAEAERQLVDAEKLRDEAIAQHAQELAKVDALSKRVESLDARAQEINAEIQPLRALQEGLRSDIANLSSAAVKTSAGMLTLESLLTKPDETLVFLADRIKPDVADSLQTWVFFDHLLGQIKDAAAFGRAATTLLAAASRIRAPMLAEIVYVHGVRLLRSAARDEAAARNIISALPTDASYIRRLVHDVIDTGSAAYIDTLVALREDNLRAAGDTDLTDAIIRNYTGNNIEDNVRALYPAAQTFWSEAAVANVPERNKEVASALTYLRSKAPRAFAPPANVPLPYLLSNALSAVRFGVLAPRCTLAEFFAVPPPEDPSSGTAARATLENVVNMADHYHASRPAPVSLGSRKPLSHHTATTPWHERPKI